MTTDTAPRSSLNIVSNEEPIVHLKPRVDDDRLSHRQLKDGAFSAVLEDLAARAAALSSALPARGLALVRGAVDQLIARARALAGDPPGLEENARRIALTTGLCVEAVLLGEVAGRDDGAQRFDRFARARLGGLLG
jgi:hypothetical protein